jgi:hypothetical protein
LRRWHRPAGSYIRDVAQPCDAFHKKWRGALRSRTDQAVDPVATARPLQCSSGRRFFVAVGCAGSAACTFDGLGTGSAEEGDGGSHVAAGTRADADVSYDCTQTDICRTGRAGMAAQDCITEMTQVLNISTPEELATFRRLVRDCRARVSCDYVQCVQATSAHPLRYSLLQQQPIEYSCSQSIACSVEKGAPTGTHEACVAQESTRLDLASPADRLAFEQHHARCKELSSCAFFACK